MHLRHGVTVEQAVTTLNEAIMETVHVTSSVVQAEQKRQAYLNWADATLQRVRTVFSGMTAPVRHAPAGGGTSAMAIRKTLSAAEADDRPS